MLCFHCPSAFVLLAILFRVLAAPGQKLLCPASMCPGFCDLASNLNALKNTWAADQWRIRKGWQDGFELASSLHKIGSKNSEHMLFNSKAWSLVWNTSVKHVWWFLLESVFALTNLNSHNIFKIVNHLDRRTLIYWKGAQRKEDRFQKGKSILNYKNKPRAILQMMKQKPKLIRHITTTSTNCQGSFT